MNKEELLTKISNLYKFQLVNPFPYEDTSRIKVDFQTDFELLEDESLNADFNDYCTVIVGTISYILKGNVAKIPKKQIDLLCKSFFERFPQYCFIEASLVSYPDFQNEYNNHEQTRKLILEFLHSN
ncbi:YxiJ-like family protein [Paenibacillus sp. MER TA 81-3]|uniref:YxiJ-like family protein n=1 Tax=Paenibacillus sp. MER TA 81-3 TaxID=2939573 RepID=UPI00203D1777|nr:YxiJ-like family protein [Paenibacillus sp. MER TA 81-3]MCM3341865.1 YxiJ-like family protein [Paenibacillus sp. MER TA 81-3]